MNWQKIRHGFFQSPDHRWRVKVTPEGKWRMWYWPKPRTMMVQHFLSLEEAWGYKEKIEAVLQNREKASEAR